MQRIEWQQEIIDRRLSDGAETFSEVRGSIKDIHEQLKPKPVPVWKVISLAVTIMVLVGAWIWQAARYPDRIEFNEARAAGEAKAEAVKNDVNQLKLEQVKIQADVQQIKSSQIRTEADIKEIKNSVTVTAPRRR